MKLHMLLFASLAGALLSTTSFAQRAGAHFAGTQNPRQLRFVPMPSALDVSNHRKAKGGKHESVEGEVLVLHASNSGGGVAPELRKLSQLKRPPFSSYDTYRLLGKYKLHLTKTRFGITKLPNERELKTSLRGILPDGRYQLVASISKKKDKEKNKGRAPYLPLLRVTTRGGETFFVAGQSYKKGILVIGIRVGSGKSRSNAPKKKRK